MCCCPELCICSESTDGNGFRWRMCMEKSSSVVVVWPVCLLTCWAVLLGYLCLIPGGFWYVRVLLGYAWDFHVQSWLCLHQVLSSIWMWQCYCCSFLINLSKFCCPGICTNYVLVLVSQNVGWKFWENSLERRSHIPRREKTPLAKGGGLRPVCPVAIKVLFRAIAHPYDNIPVVWSRPPSKVASIIDGCCKARSMSVLSTSTLTSWIACHCEITLLVVIPWYTSVSASRSRFVRSSQTRKHKTVTNRLLTTDFSRRVVLKNVCVKFVKNRV
jgi:hypothetical protein